MVHLDSSHPIVTRGSRVSRAPARHTLPAFLNLDGRIRNNARNFDIQGLSENKYSASFDLSHFQIEWNVTNLVRERFNADYICENISWFQKLTKNCEKPEKHFVKRTKSSLN